MSVEIPACPSRGGTAVFLDSKGRIERVFTYKDKSLVEIKEPISKEAFFKKCKNVKLENWGTPILPAEVRCSPGHWAIISGRRIWVP